LLISRLPNLFDQYSQEENRVTNALLQTLAFSPQLARSFLKEFVGISLDIRRDQLVIATQKSPHGKGDQADSKKADSDRDTVPDGWLACEERDWTVILESKVRPGMVRIRQLRGHLRTGSGYRRRYLVILTPDEQAPRKLEVLKGPDHRIRWRRWSDVYHWILRVLRSANDGTSAGHVLRDLKGFLEMSTDGTLVGFQGFPENWPDHYQVSDARIHLKRLRSYVRDRARDLPAELMPTDKRIHEPWLSLGSGDLHLSLYVWPEWAGVDLWVASRTARRRLKPPHENEFLAGLKRLPDRAHLWLTADEWRLINPIRGKMVGPNYHPVLFELGLERAFARANETSELLNSVLAASFKAKALSVQYRFYYADTGLKSVLSSPRIGDRLLLAAKRLVGLYSWFRRSR
jgi:hypothetical protein